MMDNILLGINSFVSLTNFIGIFLGVFSGIVIGVLPGLGAAMAMAIFVPLTYGQPAILSICFLLGIYKGSVYGGSVSAILINTPGTPAAAATMLDGYPLAKMGKGGKALKMAIYSSVIADTASDIMLILFSVPLALMALKFGPPEFFTLMIFSLTIVAGVSGGSLWKGLLCTNLGIFLSIIGTDTFTGSLRFTFGWIDIMGGLPLIPILIGLFAVSEIMIQFEGQKSELVNRPKAFDLGINVLTWKEFKACIPAIIRSTFIGTGIGAIPGIGATVSAFVSYGVNKRASKNPEEFGKGSLEGIAAAEAGNNAVCGATLIPLLAFGIPGDVVVGVLMGAFFLQGIIPGPNLFQETPDLVYGIFTGLLLCNLATILIARIGLRGFCRLATIRKGILFPIVAVLCCVGAFAVDFNTSHIFIMIFFGLVGYILRKYGYPLAPLVISFLLGPMTENELRRSLLVSNGSWAVFFTRPISLIFLIMAALSLYFIIKRELHRSH